MKIVKLNSSKKSSINQKADNFTKKSKSKLVLFRFLSILLWVIAIGLEITAIILLRKPSFETTMIIVLIVVNLLFVIIGSILWKKANRLKPASSKEKLKFFIQNQLGVIISVIAFLPLFILILNNKNLSKQQKKILGSVSGIALLIAGVTSADFNPPSKEKYLEEIQEVRDLNNDLDNVYWTKSGRSYHLYSECSYINTYRTSEIFEGNVAQAKDLKNIVDLCDRCHANALKK